MPLHHFRKRQKIIYWVVAIIIIPSFTLVWGVGRKAQDVNSGGDRAIVYGETVSNHDFAQFSDRLKAAVGNPGIGGMSGVQFMLPQGGSLPPEISNLFAMATLAKAEEAGIGVSMEEIGSFIRKDRRFVKFEGDEEGLKKAIDRMLDEYRLNRAQYIKGVEEWLKIKRYVQAMDKTPIATEQTAFARYQAEKAKFTYKELTVHITEKMSQQASDNILGITKENPTGDEELFLRNAQDFLTNAQKENDRRFWTKAKWRFEYVLAPFDSLKDPKITEAELDEYYKMNKASFGEKTFEEAKDQVLEKVIREKQQDFASSTLSRGDFEEYIRNCIVNNTPPSLKDIVNLDGLKRRNIIVGVSGDKPLTTDNLETIKEIGPSRSLVNFLNSLDRMGEGKEREDKIQKLKELFDNQNPLLESDKGCFRIRLLDYIPGKPSTLKGEDGKIDGVLRSMILLELQKKEEMRLAKIEAEKYSALVEKGEIEDFKDQITTSTVDYYKLPYVLREASLFKPVLQDSDKGCDILVLTKRELPTLAEYEAEKGKDIKTDISMVQSQMRGYDFFLNMGIVHTGARLATMLTDDWQEKKIALITIENKR
ncbi:MAG: SurA N-terminal domain-containing protein [Planctomycetes bacterium]|nr:SurA N-terminal domain-containing protein [Planctomycetota bacterium]